MKQPGKSESKLEGCRNSIQCIFIYLIISLGAIARSYATVELKDGHITEVDLNHSSQYVSEKENQSNKKQVKEYLIQLLF